MPKLKIHNSNETLEIQNVFCIGKNYLDHIKELDTPENAAEIPKEPVIFLKPNSAALIDSDVVKIPEVDGKKLSHNLQNEVELVIIIGKDSDTIPENEAENYIYGYAAGIDFTLRDVQSEQKKKGLPWATSKGFKTSAPISEIVKKNEIANPQNLGLCLKINGEIKQNSNTSLMIFNINYIVHYISSIFGLRRGDIIFTGTPSGITRLNTRDIVEAEIEQIGKLKVKIG